MERKRGVSERDICNKRDTRIKRERENYKEREREL
jgi:hypothetical protein